MIKLLAVCSAISNKDIGEPLRHFEEPQGKRRREKLFSRCFHAMGNAESIWTVGTSHVAGVLSTLGQHLTSDHPEALFRPF
jgi:hypothetical protein